MTLSDNIFESLNNLPDLELYRIGLQRLPGNDSMALWMEQLSLEFNNLTTLLESIFKCQFKLKSLESSGNILRNLPTNIFRYEANLEYLSLSDTNRTILTACGKFD